MACTGAADAAGNVEDEDAGVVALATELARAMAPRANREARVAAVRETMVYSREMLGGK
jgi:hypothetical protein